MEESETRKVVKTLKIVVRDEQKENQTNLKKFPFLKTYQTSKHITISTLLR